jgi:hypothetical protein
LDNEGIVAAMRLRASSFLAASLLAVCLLCQVAEIFDRWDHTLQTGDDTEYTFVVLALCAGAAVSLKWVAPGMAALNFRARANSDRLARGLLPIRLQPSQSVLIPASPPPVSLRI